MRPYGLSAQHSALDQGHTTLIVLRSLDEMLTKRYALDADQKLVKYSYQNAFRFQAEPHRVRGLHDLFELLKKLETQPDCCIVRAELSRGVKPYRPITRRLHATTNIYSGEVETPDLCAHPEGQPWLMVDLDDLDCPEDIKVEAQPTKAVAYARSILPAWLANADCVYQWSSSAGTDGFKKLKLHLFFWMGERRPDTSLARYFTHLLKDEHIPVDPAVYRTVQIHYTAAPLLDEGVPAFFHFPRTGFLKGSTRHATPPVHIPTATGLKAELDAQTALKRRARDQRIALQELGLIDTPHTRRLEAYARGALVHSAERMRQAPTGLRHTTLLAEALGLARLSGAGLLDGDEVLELLLSVGTEILTDRRQPSKEVQDIWAWAEPRGTAQPFLAEELEVLAKKEASFTPELLDPWAHVTPVNLETGRLEVARLIRAATQSGGAHCIAASPSLGKSFAANEDAILPVVLTGGRAKLLLPSNDLLDEKQSELLVHASRWYDAGRISAEQYNQLVDGIKKFPTRNYDNCNNFQAYRGMDRAMSGGGARYCAMCSDREICEISGFLRAAKSAHEASVLLTTPHLETRLAGHDVALGSAEAADPLLTGQVDVKLSWQDIARTLAAHPDDTLYSERAHRTPRAISLSIAPDPHGWPIDVWLDEHFFARSADATEAASTNTESGEDEDGEDDTLAALSGELAPETRYSWSLEGRDAVRRWFTSRRHGSGGSREELRLLYQTPTSWDWDLLVIDESPLGAMHDTLELGLRDLTQLFSSGALVGPSRALERLGSLLTQYRPAGDTELAHALRELGLAPGIHAATFDAQTLALLARAAIVHAPTAAYIERITALTASRTLLEGSALLAALDAPPAQLVWDETLLIEHAALPLARLLERAARAGWAHCKLTRAGLRVELPDPAHIIWEQLCKLGAPHLIFAAANALPDWRAAHALLTTASAPVPFEGCWTRGATLHIPLIKRLDTTQARTTLYLDGTADPLTAAAVAPGCAWHPVQLMRPDSTEVVQIKLCATPHKITESADQMRRWICAHAVAEASHPGQTLHIVHKSVNPAVAHTLSQGDRTQPEFVRARGLLLELLGPDASSRLLHHNASLGRGSNQWQDTSAVVVDAWRVPRHAITERARVLRTLTGADEGDAIASARFALEAQNVIQEVHRARPLLGKTTVFILDDRELPGLRPDVVWDTTELDLVVWRMTGHMPYHHTRLTLHLLKEAVLRQGGLVLGQSLFCLEEEALRPLDGLRKGLSQTFLQSLIGHLPPSPLRLEQAVMALVQDHLGGAWSKLADAAGLACVKARTSLQNRELLLLMPQDHTGEDVVRVLSGLPDVLWFQLGEERVYRFDPHQTLKSWLTACAPEEAGRWDLLPGDQARRQLIWHAKSHGYEASHPRLAAAMRLCGMGIAELRQAWRTVHGMEDQQEIPWGQRAALDEQAAARAEARAHLMDELSGELEPGLEEAKRPAALIAALVAEEHGLLIDHEEADKTSCLVWCDEQGWHIAPINTEEAPATATVHWRGTPIGLWCWFVNR